MVNSQAELAITSLISNKRERNNCFKLQKFGSAKYERKKRENRAKSKKLDEDAMLCNTLWSERRWLVTKTFLAFLLDPKRRN